MTAQPNPRPLFSENHEANGLSYYGAPTRPLYWSVWRELWENRSIYIAPLIVAAVQVFGFAISTIGLAERRRAVLLLEPAKQRAAIEIPYDIAAMMMLFTVFIVGVFYCLDALHVWMRCTANVAIAASCSGSRCRFRTSPPCSRKRSFRSQFCPWSPSL